MKRSVVTSIVVLFSIITYSQYEITGHVNDEFLGGNIYFSTIDDYRKISGVFQDQILQKTAIDHNGTFIFTGDNLPVENRLYRIHVDTCSEDEQAANHFDGHCSNSKEIIFIANNNSRIQLPLENNDIFSKITANQESAKTILKIDSLKTVMQSDFLKSPSKASKKLNTTKWFNTFEKFSNSLNEPLAELYAFSILSNTSQPFHQYYKKDLSQNNYYDQLYERLEKKYPHSSYTSQYKNQLIIDRYQPEQQTNNRLLWYLILAVLLSLSLVLNFILWNKYKNKKQHKDVLSTLSSQEQKILELIKQEMSNKEIASELFISLSTVKTHINNIYKKLNVSSRKDAINL